MQPTFDLPRSYRTKPIGRILAFGIAIFFIAASVVVVERQQLPKLFLLLPICFWLPACFVLMRDRVTLGLTGVEKARWFRTETLQYEAIEGRRRTVIDTGKCRVRAYALVPKTGKGQEIVFGLAYNFDDDFDDWFQSLRDLDNNGVFRSDPWA